MRTQIFGEMVIGLSLLSGQLFSQNVKPEKPNLIFIFSDQQTADMLGCYGNKDIKTPNLDRFASEGVQFNYCISSCPVCTPYRGMILSGMHPLHNGAITNDIQMLPGNSNYFGEVLRDAGYHTGYYGKWHLYGGDRVRAIPPGPFRYGFDHEFLSNNCTLEYDSARSYFWNEKGEKELYGDWEWNVQTKQAIGFIEKHGQEPFALFLSWHAPHDWMPGRSGEHKYSAPEEFKNLYDPRSIQLRDNCEDTGQHRLFYQGHMAMISSIDRDFGEIIKKLEEKGIADNSIIIFTSDHGDMLESHGWSYNKGRPEIESIHVPLMVKWQKNLKPRESDLLIGTLDLMPTVLGLMNLPVPETCHGKDLSDAIITEKDNSIQSIPLFYFPADWRGVYTRDYTYAFNLRPLQGESSDIKFNVNNYDVLYEHQADPYELNNLFKNEKFQKIKNDLHELSREWMKKFGDKGIPINDLLPEVMLEEDYRIFQIEPRNRGDKWEGRLKGRPVDYQDIPRNAPNPNHANTGNYLIGTFRCPLWNDNFRRGCWDPIKKYSERKPVLGWYNEGNPETTDWEIKYAVEHGISFFVECWFRKKDNLGKPAENVLGHWLDGLTKSRYKDQIKFMIMWENINGIASGIESEDDLMKNLMPFWINEYFKKPNYLLIEGKPVFMIYGYKAFIKELGGEEKATSAMVKMREACVDAGFKGLWIIAEHHLEFNHMIPEVKNIGFDAITSYHWPSFSGLMPEVPKTQDEILEKQVKCWSSLENIANLPSITTVSMGWDSEPWGSTYYIGQWYVDPEHFRKLCLKAKRHIDTRQSTSPFGKMLLLDNWNEFGEGHYIFPTRQFGFGYLDAIRDVFSDAHDNHRDLVPEGTGFTPYIENR